MEMDKLESKIAVIGVGNMGQAIVSGLLKQKLVLKKNLFLSNSSEDNKGVAENSDIIILAVKPQQINQVLLRIKDVVSIKQLIISIVAGVEIKTIKKLLNRNQRVVRVMPNLNAVIGKSVSVWARSKEVTKDQSKLVKTIISCLGQEILINNESELDKVTAISGSGPAYVFYLAELLDQAAVIIGLERKIATKLAIYTLIGSAYLLENTDKHPGILRSEVTSKGGTTEAAFKEFAKGGLDKVFLKGIKAAYKRAQELHLK